MADVTQSSVTVFSCFLLSNNLDPGPGRSYSPSTMHVRPSRQTEVVARENNKKSGEVR